MGRIEGLCTKCKEFHWSLHPYKWKKGDTMNAQFLCDRCYANRASKFVIWCERLLWNIQHDLRRK
jgi:hypothetical protein